MKVLELCKFCLSATTNAELTNGVCLLCQKTIDEARPIERPQKLIVDCATGTQTYADLTDEEILERKKSMQTEEELEQELWEG